MAKIVAEGIAVRPKRKRLRKQLSSKAGLCPIGKAKVKKVMTELKKRKLRHGSKKGPIVTSPRVGIAIALSEAKKASARGSISKKKK